MITKSSPETAEENDPRVLLENLLRENQVELGGSDLNQLVALLEQTVKPLRGQDKKSVRLFLKIFKDTFVDLKTEEKVKTLNLLIEIIKAVLEKIKGLGIEVKDAPEVVS